MRVSSYICPAIISVALLSCSVHSRSDFQTKKNDSNLTFAEIGFDYGKNYHKTVIDKILENNGKPFEYEYSVDNGKIKVEVRLPKNNHSTEASDDSDRIKIKFDNAIVLPKDCADSLKAKIELSFTGNGNWSINDKDTKLNIENSEKCENVKLDEIEPQILKSIAGDFLARLKVLWPLPSKSYKYTITGSIDKRDDDFFAVHIKKMSSNSPLHHRFHMAYDYSESRCMTGFENKILGMYPGIGDSQTNSQSPLTITIPEKFLRRTAAAFLFSGYGCQENDPLSRGDTTASSDSYKRIFFYLNSDGSDFGATKNNQALHFENSGYEIFIYEIESGTWKETSRNHGNFNLPFTIYTDSGHTNSASYLKLKSLGSENALLSQLIALPKFEVTEYLPPGVELKKIGCQKDRICRLEFDFSKK